MSIPVMIVCGGRDYHPGEDEAFMLKVLLRYFRPRVVFHGGAPGVDRWAAWHAKDNGFEEREFAADWDTHGNAAGPMRNETMAIDAAEQDKASNEQSVCVAFPGGGGTANMVRNAYEYGLALVDLRRRAS